MRRLLDPCGTLPGRVWTLTSASLAVWLMATVALSFAHFTPIHNREGSLAVAVMMLVNAANWLLIDGSLAKACPRPPPVQISWLAPVVVTLPLLVIAVVWVDEAGARGLASLLSISANTPILVVLRARTWSLRLGAIRGAP